MSSDGNPDFLSTSSHFYHLFTALVSKDPNINTNDGLITLILTINLSLKSNGFVVFTNLQSFSLLVLFSQFHNKGQ
jgi:hypothetical protein